MIPLSGYYLDANWKKTETRKWIRGLDTITYDGVNFMYYKFPDCIINTEFGIEVKPKKVSFIEDLKR